MAVRKLFGKAERASRGSLGRRNRSSASFRNLIWDDGSKPQRIIEVLSVCSFKLAEQRKKISLYNHDQNVL
ncbi:hypothetical protein HNY73_005761 [Argiope bruennichi]|uniref:Uncharacterized protein n=1 Tax=Argiope bruennichi TaxID=94029 RepID=A0A8T0FK84_ARGBR|nr:hypothetical protein HNY73_005761 [Argiope bruennichi]